MDSGSRLVYQSKAFPLRVRTNYFTNKSPHVPIVSHVSLKWATCYFGLPFTSNYWNLDGWYPLGILRLSILFVYDMKYKKKVWASPPYWFLMEFTIVFCNYRTNSDAIEVEFCGWLSCITAFPLSLVFFCSNLSFLRFTHPYTCTNLKNGLC